MDGRAVCDLADAEYRHLAQTRRLLRRYLAFSENAALRSGIEPRQYQALLVLRGGLASPQADATVSDLADWLQIRHHSAVGLVDRMQARGLVQRQTDARDGRRVLVTLTPTGHDALRGLAVLHRDELRRLAPELVDALLGAINAVGV